MAQQNVSISVMLSVSDTPRAVAWYEKALGARVLWSLGTVAGLEIEGAPFFLHEPVKGFNEPNGIGATSCRVEIFVDSPDELLQRAIQAGGEGSGEVKSYEAPWGTHRQGGFTDPFGHIWQVGDRSPLGRFPA